jgi:putative DNA primase/helicase
VNTTKTGTASSDPGSGLAPEPPETLATTIPEPDQARQDQYESVDSPATAEPQRAKGTAHKSTLSNGMTPEEWLHQGDAARFASPPPIYLKNGPRTDSGNAERLRALYGEDLLYVDRWKSWLVWDGTRWRKDDVLRVQQMALVTIREMQRSVQAYYDGPDRDKFIGWSGRQESNDSLNAMVSRARQFFSVTPDEFDRDPWKLNLLNGTLNLKTGKFSEEHARGDFITKLAPVRYNPSATCPVFDGFIRKALKEDTELLNLVQEIMGYMLTGTTRSKAGFVIVYGPPDCGKSIFADMMHDLLGPDYSTKMMDDALLARRKTSANNDAIAGLFGVRYASLSETNEGDYLNLSMIKTLLGSKRVKAMRKYEREFEFTPQAKFIIDTNNRPGIKGMDDGIWERLQPIPFRVQIPKDDQDLDLGLKLRRERSGILNFALAGERRWFKQNGFTESAVSNAAKDEYKARENRMQQFIDERCTLGEDCYAPSYPLFQAFRDFARENINTRTFAERMRKLGFEDRSRNTGTIWLGLQLKNTLGLELKDADEE